MLCAQKLKKVLYPALSLLGVLLAWQLVVVCGLVPNYLLPTPIQVFGALVKEASLLFAHTKTTLIEALIGLVIGTVVGSTFAILMDRFEGFYLTLEPLVTISQTIPTIAIAPLLVLWLGYGLLPKIVLVALTTFFPVLVSLLAGLRSVDPDMIDLMRVMRASRWQIFVHVKLPAAAEQFFAGLSIAAAYAIVGAVIAEWLGGISGLGVYMTRVRKSFSYDRMFAAIIVISTISLVLMGVIRALERAAMPWKQNYSNKEGVLHD
ncbi:ABC transporter permease [Atopobium fossor]|uniref:ABC transporter permease n=1 Tax=Atopobium fossor TaxID=39487 RepID=UPI000416BEE0|nr:ABC transporter permease [Atopobium fossor]